MVGRDKLGTNCFNGTTFGDLMANCSLIYFAI